MDILNGVEQGQSAAVDLSAPGTIGATTPGLVFFKKGADIASATPDLSAATGNVLDVTGTTTITSFGTVAVGAVFWLRFTGSLILTYHATSMILPITRNITTSAGDRACIVSLGGGNWYFQYLESKLLELESLDLSSATWSVPWGVSVVSGALTLTSSTTLTNIPGLVQTGLIAGKTYTFRANVDITSTENTGAKFAFAGTGLTVTSISILANTYAPTTGALVTHTKEAAALAGVLCAATAAVESIEITGRLVVNAAGSIRLQAAPNASHGDTFSISSGDMQFTQVTP